MPCAAFTVLHRTIMLLHGAFTMVHRTRRRAASSPRPSVDRSKLPSNATGRARCCPRSHRDAAVSRARSGSELASLPAAPGVARAPRAGWQKIAMVCHGRHTRAYACSGPCCNSVPAASAAIAICHPSRPTRGSARSSARSVWTAPRPCLAMRVPTAPASSCRGPGGSPRRCRAIQRRPSACTGPPARRHSEPGSAGKARRIRRSPGTLCPKPAMIDGNVASSLCPVGPERRRGQQADAAPAAGGARKSRAIFGLTAAMCPRCGGDA